MRQVGFMQYVSPTGPWKLCAWLNSAVQFYVDEYAPDGDVVIMNVPGTPISRGEINVCATAGTWCLMGAMHIAKAYRPEGLR